MITDLKTTVKRSIEQNLRIKNLRPETEIMKETPWPRIKWQNKNSVDKGLWEIVGNEKQTRSDEQARLVRTTPQKPKTQIKKGMTVEKRATVCEIFLSGRSSSQII